MTFESSDGRFLYYAKGPGLAGLWRAPTNGGEEVELISSLEAGYWGYWAVADNGIYYLDAAAKPEIVFFNFATQRTTRVFNLENRPAKEAPGLAISPDNKTILYPQLDASNSDIMLVANFLLAGPYSHRKTTQTQYARSEAEWDNSKRTRCWTSSRNGAYDAANLSG